MVFAEVQIPLRKCVINRVPKGILTYIRQPGDEPFLPVASPVINDEVLTRPVVAPRSDEQQLADLLAAGQQQQPSSVASRMARSLYGVRSLYGEQVADEAVLRRRTVRKSVLLPYRPRLFDGPIVLGSRRLFCIRPNWRMPRMGRRVASPESCTPSCALLRRPPDWRVRRWPRQSGPAGRIYRFVLFAPRLPGY